MVMRINVDFPRPLAPAEHRQVILAMAALAKVRRVLFTNGAHRAQVFGEALGTRSVRAALEDIGLTVKALSSTLPEGDDVSVDDVPTATVERVKAIGR